jgi:hypothetical protein
MRWKHSTVLIKIALKSLNYHEDSDNSKSKSSSKIFYWVSTDLSAGNERLIICNELS